MEPHSDAAFADAVELFEANERFFLGAAFSKPTRASAPHATLLPPETAGRLEKIRVKPAGNGAGYFAEFFTGDKAFHRTLSRSGFLALMEALCPALFRTASLRFCLPEHTLTATLAANKRGRLTLLQSKQAAEKPPALAAPDESGAAAEAQHGARTQNREKQYLIPEGRPAPFLVRLGIMTPQGRVIASKRKKFRQINRFLEQIDDVVRVLDARRLRRGGEWPPFRIADFGSGKSYLSFAAHHLFAAVYQRPVVITAVDKNAELTAACAELARLLRCEGLSFYTGAIEELAANPAGAPEQRGPQKPPPEEPPRQESPPLRLQPPDLLITLHACDVATDFALAYAIKNNVPAIISVPCCQHELNSLLDAKGLAAEFAPLVSHGLLRERFSALATDALRAEALERAGYAVVLSELVTAEDTPKNLLLRAVKKDAAADAARNPQAAGESALGKALGVTLTLEKLLRPGTG